MGPLAHWAQDAVNSSLIVGLPVALLAGFVSFFSPCVLPLLPGYLSYATGLSAGEVVQGTGRRRRMLAGTSLFVLGFGVVFVVFGVVAGGLGAALATHLRTIEIIAGLVCIVVGLIFADAIPLGQRTVRPARVGAVGLAAAPLLGAAFAFGWTPCIGPTLSVVMSLAMSEGSAVRGGVLAVAYALGLGLPFIIIGLAFDRFAGTVAWFKRHGRAVQRVGGVLLIIVGLLLLSGWWNVAVRSVQTLLAGIEAPL